MAAASSRWTLQQCIDVDCPRCRRPLPPIPVDVTTRASGRTNLTLDVQARLDDPWWAAARAQHPRCLPPGAGTADDGEVLER